ncbi:MAG: AAA family ATPase [Gammaproteobacteria bacterium]|nr:AAA family ATPase [Gammaproteobacteria bacterium]
MRAPVIQSIASLKQLPVFPDDSTVSESPRLRKYNVVYGFNGCGKTTLSRVFACLGTGERHEDWAADSTYTVKFTDGTQVRTESLDAALKQRILVFNIDFIARKLRWKEGEANPIFYLGRDQKDLSEQIDKQGERAEVIDGRLRRVVSIRNGAEQAFVQHKRDRARLIESEVGLGRRYNATNLDSDYYNYTYEDPDLLDEDGIGAQRQLLKLDNPLPKLPRISEETHALNDVVHEVRNLLQTTLGTISIDALREHDAILPWIKDGLEYHKAHNLKSCLLCGNPLTDDRVSLIESAIGDRYDTLVNDVAATKQTAEVILDTLADSRSGLPSKNDVVKDQRTSFADAANALRSSIDDGRKHIERAIELLNKKQDSPNTQIVPGDLPELSDAHQWMSEYIERTKALNKVIDAHNVAHDDFTFNQNAAKGKLKKHYLAEGYERYRELALYVEKAERVEGALQNLRDELIANIAALKQQMRQHGPAADRVNTMIHRYLGHDELEIAAKNEGYEIRRNGKVTTAAPSEGEKTAIALSYFLVLLEADGRKREDLIVVMDDPISSLDTCSLNYACSLVKSLDNVAQLIILTHNSHVLNELKKWLRNRTEKEMEKRGRSKEDASAALLFIDTVQPHGNHSRRSRIVELPKHLREYESEYHYLFHMVLRFLDAEEDRTNYFFVMPNVLRKILEIFLAFKRPGSSGLSSKIEGLAREAEDIGIDQIRIRALDRLAHVESHGDNIDDLVTASSMTVEETTVAAESLLELVEMMDSEHSRRMHRQCQPAA